MYKERIQVICGSKFLVNYIVSVLYFILLIFDLLLIINHSLAEHGKGRKCVILVGRPREVYNMSWSALERAGGLQPKEYWTKLSLDGMVLYTTGDVQDVLGFSSGELC